MNRDYTKMVEEFDTKYEDTSRIYASEINAIRNGSTNEYDLIMNSIKFGYIIGRRAEKNHRAKRRTHQTKSHT